MPFAALAFALVALAGSLDPAAAGSASKPVLAQQPSVSLLLAFDDEVHGEQNNEDDGTYSEDPDFNYGYDGEDDDEGNSAHGPGDDEDDGWDIDETVRSERA